MSNFTPLIEYQQIDITLKKLLQEVERNPEMRKLEKTKTEFSTAKQTLSDSETEAQKITDFFAQAKNTYAESEKKVADINAALEAMGDDVLTGRKELVSQLESTRDRLSNLERRLATRRKDGETVVKSYREAQERGKKLKEEHAKLKEHLDVFRKEKEPKIEMLKKKLQQKRAELDPSLFARYKALTADGKYPPLAESASVDGGKTFTCRGCGLSISQAAKSELLQNGCSTCDNCKRMIYKAADK